MQSAAKESAQRPTVIISNCGNITSTVTNTYADSNYNYGGFFSDGFTEHNAGSGSGSGSRSNRPSGAANAARGTRMPGTSRTYSHQKTSTSTSTSHSQSQTRANTAHHRAQRVPVPDFTASGDRLGADIQNYVYDMLSLHGLGHHLPRDMGPTGFNVGSDGHPYEQPKAEAEDPAVGTHTTTETYETLDSDGNRTKTRTVHVTQDSTGSGQRDTGIRVYIDSDPGLYDMGSSTGTDPMASGPTHQCPPPAYSTSPPNTQIVVDNLNNTSTPTRTTTAKPSDDGVNVTRGPRKSWIKRMAGKFKRSLSWIF